MEQDRLGAAVRIMAERLRDGEDETHAALLAHGFTDGEAERLVAFVPLAFARPLLERLGATGLPSFVLTAARDGRRLVARLDW